MKVLIVDDYGTMRRIIRTLLNEIGYNDVDEASNGREALEKLRAARYGLVISDWQMQPMTGYDLLKEVRADSRLCDTPFIIVTAEAQNDKLAAAQTIGVDECLVEPFLIPECEKRSVLLVRPNQSR